MYILHYVCTLIYLFICILYLVRPWDFRWSFSSTEPLCPLNCVISQKWQSNDYIIDVICKKRHHYHFITFAVVHFNFSFRKKIFFHHTTTSNTIMIFFLWKFLGEIHFQNFDTNRSPCKLLLALSEWNRTYHANRRKSCDGGRRIF